MPFDCGTCIAKYVLCLFNFIVFLVGSAVLAIGIWVAADKESFISLLKVVNNEELKEFTQPAVIEQASYILIAAGAFMFIVSFLGYCGALRESKCLLSTYGVCLVIILVMEITAGGLVAAYRGKVDGDKASIGTRVFHWCWAEFLICVNYLVGIMAVVTVLVATSVMRSQLVQRLKRVSFRVWTLVVGIASSSLLLAACLLFLIALFAIVAFHIGAIVALGLLVYWLTSVVFLTIVAGVFVAALFGVHLMGAWCGCVIVLHCYRKVEAFVVNLWAGLGNRRWIVFQVVGMGRYQNRAKF